MYYFFKLLFVLLPFTISGPLPNKVSTCGLNNKIKLSETVLDVNQRIDDYQLNYVSKDSLIVFIRTHDGNIFRSADEGYTWTKQTVPEIMPNINTFQGGIHQMYYSEVVDGTISIYFLSADFAKLWVSNNGGNTYTYYDTMPANMRQLYMHPIVPGTVLGLRNNNNMNEIWLSQEYGKTWTKLVDNLPLISRVAWSIFPENNPNRIYLLKYKDPYNPNQRDAVIVYSDDFFQTVSQLSIDHVLDWHIYKPNKFVVVTCAETITCISRHLYVSDDAGKTFNLIEIPEIRQETPDERSFMVWEISDDAIWTYIERSSSCPQSMCWGDLFHSNAADNDFTLSLQYNKILEFTKYNSLDGIYLANQYITKGGLPESDDLVRSLITFNKGSEWNILKAPDLDANHQPTSCKIEEGCSLHVHGFSWTDPFTYFYSPPNAVGLMIASGNLGNRLESREDEVNTYASFNGGVSWEEVRKYDYVPEVGDYGSVIVLVREDGITNEVIYTINDGFEWPSCIFTDQPFDVSNIRVSQNWVSRRFVLYGHRDINGTTHPVVVQLNLEDEFSGKCTDDDYERWSPKDEHSNCVMGVAKYYKKRKLGRSCYIGEDLTKAIETEVCACTPYDYECDHCFYRKDLGSPCSLECSVPNLPPPPPNICNSTGLGYYEVDLGYRLVDNNKCNVSLSKTPKPKGLIPCPSNTPPNVPSRVAITSGLSAIPIVILIVIFLLCGAGGIYYLYKTNDSFYNFVSYTFGIEDSGRSPLRYDNVEQGQSLAEHIDEGDDQE